MKNTKKATSIIESMIIMLIIVTWITWLYNIFNESTKLSNTTKNRIEAIEIAREGIEAMKNIRDTNWLMYGWDTVNCFNTLNYDQRCIWNISWASYIEDNKSYKIYKHIDNKWYLNENPTWDFSDNSYRSDFRVYKDNDWFYTQTWSTNETIFTREIQVSYSWSTNIMNINSLVNWADSSKEWFHKVEIWNIITNWKQN